MKSERQIKILIRNYENLLSQSKDSLFSDPKSKYEKDFLQALKVDILILESKIQALRWVLGK